MPFLSLTPPRNVIRSSGKLLCALLTPLRSKVIKIFCFGVTVWTWPGCHFEGFAVKNKMLVTSLYIVQYASNFICIIRIPPWTHSHAHVQPPPGDSKWLKFDMSYLSELLLQILSECQISVCLPVLKWCLWCSLNSFRQSLSKKKKFRIRFSALQVKIYVSYVSQMNSRKWKVKWKAENLRMLCVCVCVHVCARVCTWAQKESINSNYCVYLLICHWSLTKTFFAWFCYR